MCGNNLLWLSYYPETCTKTPGSIKSGNTVKSRNIIKIDLFTQHAPIDLQLTKEQKYAHDPASILPFFHVTPLYFSHLFFHTALLVKCVICHKPIISWHDRKRNSFETLCASAWLKNSTPESRYTAGLNGRHFEILR